MVRFIILAILMIAFTCCRSKKTVQNVERQEESANVQLVKESKLQHEIAAMKSMIEEFRVSSFNQALSLTPVLDSSGVAQPVQYIEKRDGKLFREIYIAGGTLNESSSQYDSSVQAQYKSLQKEHRALIARLDSASKNEFQKTNKERSVEVKGGQPSIYILLGIVMLGLVLSFVLNQVLKRV